MEDRIKQLETVVSRLSRRQVKKTAAMITPYQISSCVERDDIRDEIFRYLFCTQGTIVKVLVTLNKKIKDGASFAIKISNDLGGSSSSYIINNKNLIINPNISIDSGDKLLVYISPLGTEIISEVWLSLLFLPSTKDSEIKNYLINSLEKEDVSEE